MKKQAAVFFMLVTLFSFSGCNACDETILTKLGDTIATIGKSGIDKDKILVERKANRAAKCAEQSAGDLKKKIGF